MHNSISYDADGKDKRRSTGNTSRNTSLGPITRAQEALEKHQVCVMQLKLSNRVIISVTGENGERSGRKRRPCQPFKT